MRISNLAIKNSHINQLHKNTVSLNKAEMQLASGQRYERTSDNPIAGINSVYHKVRLNQLDQYQKNVIDSKGYVASSHDYISHTVELVQRIRELTVQSANGVHTPEDREIVALEVEELLKEIISTANSSHKDDYLFAGSKVSDKPFLAFTRSEPGLAKPLVDRVEYLGDKREIVRDIDQRERVKIGLNGNDLFWGNDNIIVSLKDSRSYLAASDQTIRIDGHELVIEEGDDLEAVVEKINRQLPSATAFIRELPDGKVVFSIESSYPHQLSIEDIKGGTVMSDLGVIHAGTLGQHPPNNIHPNTLRRGGSLFDIVMGLRDSLLENQVEDIGGKHLGSLDQTLNNLLRNQARISATQSRMQGVEKKLALDEKTPPSSCLKPRTWT